MSMVSKTMGHHVLHALVDATTIIATFESWFVDVSMRFWYVSKKLKEEIDVSFQTKNEDLITDLKEIDMSFQIVMLNGVE
jgi:hypothetical protein